jgi:anion-transporting  ArsA/GET3 family ATPase
VSPASSLAHGDFGDLVDQRRIIVCTGSGGVGKTTTAAALALAAARRDRRTIVLTIDPARRLAQSMGISELDASPRRIEAARFATTAGRPPQLDGMMLDMKRTFDDLVHRYAGSASRAQAVTDNRFYQQLTSSLAGTQEYMATEKLYELATTTDYDTIVVDTPPTRNALDFLDAPRRLTDFLEGRFLRMFLAPGMAAGKIATRAVGFSTGLFMKAFSRITGAGVLEDLGEFFQAMEGMYEGFKERALATYRLLQGPNSSFVVVATPEPPALREARYFLQRLQQDGMPTAGLVVNRVTQPPTGLLADLDRGGLRRAETRLDDQDPAERAVLTLLALAVDARDVAGRQRRAVRAALHGVDLDVLLEVPQFPTDVHDLDDLDRIGRHLTGEADAMAAAGS